MLVARRHDLALLRRLARHRHVCDRALGRIEIPVAGLAERGLHVVVAVPAPRPDRVEVALAVREGERYDPVGRTERAHMRARHRPHVEHAHLHAGIVPVRKLPLARDKARLPRRRIGIEPLFGIVIALARQKRPDAPLPVHVELRKALARRDARMPEPVRAHAPAADSPPRAEHRLRPRRRLFFLSGLAGEPRPLLQPARQRRDEPAGLVQPRLRALVRLQPRRQDLPRRKLAASSEAGQRPAARRQAAPAQRRVALPKPRRNLLKLQRRGKVRVRPVTPRGGRGFSTLISSPLLFSRFGLVFWRFCLVVFGFVRFCLVLVGLFWRSSARCARFPVRRGRRIHPVGLAFQRRPEVFVDPGARFWLAEPQNVVRDGGQNRQILLPVPSRVAADEDVARRRSDGNRGHRPTHGTPPSRPASAAR